MDFVVAGLGLGALVVVLGFAVRDLGPLFWRPSGYLAPADSVAEKRRWADVCHAIGAYSGAAGGAIILATLGAVFLGLSDSLGTLVVAIAATVALLAAAGVFARRLRATRLERAPSAVPIMTVSTVSSEAPGNVSPAKRVAQPPSQASVDSLVPDAPVKTTLPDLPVAATTVPQAETPDQGIQPESGDPVTQAAAAEPPVSLGRPAESRVEVEPIAEAASAHVPQPIEADEAIPADTSLEQPAQPAAPFESPPEPVTSSLTEPDSAAGGVFSSPLLADIGRQDEPIELASGFSSRLLADVTPGDDSATAAPVALEALLGDEFPSSGQPPEPKTAASRPLERDPGGEELLDAADDGGPAAEDTLIDARPARLPARE